MGYGIHPLYFTNPSIFSLIHFINGVLLFKDINPICISSVFFIDDLSLLLPFNHFITRLAPFQFLLFGC